MGNLPASQWLNTTAPDLLTYKQKIAGIDLFDEVHNGEVQTAIYQRFADGKRWPARTVSRGDRQRHDDIVLAWSRKGTVNDYREQKAT